MAQRKMIVLFARSRRTASQPVGVFSVDKPLRNDEIDGPCAVPVQIPPLHIKYAKHDKHGHCWCDNQPDEM